MSEPVFIDGKARLDNCYQCGESKAKIKHSQGSHNPIYCVGIDYFGEVQWEADHHVFVLDEKKYKAAKEAEEKAMADYL